MDEALAVASIEERLADWRVAEKLASEAEAELRHAGQTAADPRARALALRAKTLRAMADRDFEAITRAVRQREHAG